MAEDSVEEHYLGYKRVVSKLGFEAAQSQYRQQHNQPIALSLLIEFHYLQHEIYQYRNDPDRATRSIRAGIQLLSKDAFIHDEAQQIVQTLDWFDTIESENQDQYEGLQAVYKGFIHLPTRCELVRYVARHDPLNFDVLASDLIQIARCLNSRCLIQLSEMISSVVEEKPACAAMVRHSLVERQLLPELVTRITVLYCQDEVRTKRLVAIH
ncbi:hypothetical protein DFQ28_004692 [Apophysomyces sp. BC1034]|nr:hypothetical protein DFQ28_004692 [Apophysomyces sp. BC1034]